MFYVNHDSHEMSILIFFTKKKKRRKLECPLQILLGSLRIKNKHADLTLLTSKILKIFDVRSKNMVLYGICDSIFLFHTKRVNIFLISL